MIKLNKFDTDNILRWLRELTSWEQNIVNTESMNESELRTYQKILQINSLQQSSASFRESQRSNQLTEKER